jgi:hypothetical protein
MCHGARRWFEVSNVKIGFSNFLKTGTAGRHPLYELAVTAKSKCLQNDFYRSTAKWAYDYTV